MYAGPGASLGVLHRVALQRGVQAKRNIGITAARDIVHGEAYQSIFPRVTENLA